MDTKCLHIEYQMRKNHKWYLRAFQKFSLTRNTIQSNPFNATNACFYLWIDNSRSFFTNCCWWHHSCSEKIASNSINRIVEGQQTWKIFIKGPWDYGRIEFILRGSLKAITYAGQHVNISKACPRIVRSFYHGDSFNGEQHESFILHSTKTSQVKFYKISWGLKKLNSCYDYANYNKLITQGALATYFI